MNLVRAVKRVTVRSVFTSPRARRRTIVGLLALGAVLLGGSILLGRYVPWLTDPAAIRDGLESFGPYAPVVFVVVQAIQVVVAPIPGQVLGFASGYLFGTVAGTAYSLLGAAVGSYVVFQISRRYGRTYVERAVDITLVEQFDGLAQRRGLVALFLVFLVPGIPDDAICFVAGLTELRIREMVAVSVIGRLPGYVVVNAAGAQLAADRLTETAILVTVLVALSVLGYVYRATLIRRLSKPSR